nr:retrotransposable element Tf2 [Tanacetum cinerariifolium]
MAYFHGSSVRGHYGVKVTTHRISSMLYWKGMRKDIKKFVHECIHCQRNKLDLAAYPGLLQPLPIPNKIWESINMDFIEALPRSQGYTVIFVVVDRLTKYAHFMPLSHPFTAAQVAQEFLDTIYKLHGLPTSIVSDRDKFFLRNPQMAQVSELPSCNKEGLMKPEPVALLDRKIVKKNNAVVVYGLVQWCLILKQASFLYEFYTWTYEPIRAYYGIGSYQLVSELALPFEILTLGVVAYGMVAWTLKKKGATRDQRAMEWWLRPKEGCQP